MLRPAVAATCARAVRLRMRPSPRRNFSFWEWAYKIDRPLAVTLESTQPPRDLPWDKPVKLDLPVIEENWQDMEEAKKNAIIKSLIQKQKGDWNKMTMEEKKAAWWIEFGEHGMRKPKQPGHGWLVFGGTMLTLAGGVVFFAGLRFLSEPYGPNLTREWQEASNEQLRRHYADPITGVASEGYKGKGAIFM